MRGKKRPTLTGSLCLPPERPAVSMGQVQGTATAARKASFLEQFKAAGTISAACRAAGIDRGTHYHWLKGDPQYARDFEEAGHVRVELLETEARRRALTGWEEPVYQRGKLVGHIRKFSDTLLIFLLKAERPEKYRERYEARIKGADRPITFTLDLPRPPHVGLSETTEPKQFTIDLRKNGNDNGDES
jgi:hypothetical protein